MSSKLRNRRFHLPGVGDFNGFDDGSRWNGFCSPFLEGEEVHRLAAALEGPQFGPTIEFHDGVPGWTWEDSDWIPAEWKAAEDGSRIWAVGAREWEWMAFDLGLLE